MRDKQRIKMSRLCFEVKILTNSLFDPVLARISDLFSIIQPQW